MNIKKILKDWFTAPGNENFELARAMWAVGFVCAMGYQAADIWQGQPFDLRTFAESLGIILVGGGAATAVKDLGSGRSKP